MKKFLKNKIKPGSFPKYLFILSLCFFSLLYGFFAFPLQWFPYALIQNAITYVNENLNQEQSQPYYYVETDYTTTIPVYDKGTAYNSLSLITSVGEDSKLSAKVINMEGLLIHEWHVDWFDLWPDATHIPKSDDFYPKSRPGTMIHGAIMLENGDLIFNFERLGMVRLDVCGNVIWRLPYRTHHSIMMDQDGFLWVPGLIIHEKPLSNFPNQKPPYEESTIIKVSLDGEILKEISVNDLLMENGLEGLIFLSSYDWEFADVSGDPLHMNDAEIFPDYIEEGVFKTDDIMVSLRNTNTVLVFREDSHKIVAQLTGKFVRQHDPDFIDGNTISVYDNFSIAPEENGQQSRIVINNFKNDQSYIYYSGTKQNPFFSLVGGKHEWLPNGNLLITEATKGRAFEIDEDGNIAWEFINLVGHGQAGYLSEVHRLPTTYTEAYFEELTNNCHTD